METLEKMAMSEADRLRALLLNCGVNEKYIDILNTTIENTAWMKVKLDDARDQIKKTSVAIPYDNGGGQKGIRENPLFKGYENLFKSYLSGIRQILDVLPKQAEPIKNDEINKQKTALEIVREKHKKGV